LSDCPWIDVASIWLVHVHVTPTLLKVLPGRPFHVTGALKSTVKAPSPLLVTVITVTGIVGR
jgi:hypothetical protein